VHALHAAPKRKRDGEADGRPSVRGSARSRLHGIWFELQAPQNQPSRAASSEVPGPGFARYDCAGPTPSRCGTDTEPMIAIRTERAEDALILCVAGELDGSSAWRIVRLVRRLVRRYRVLIDLSARAAVLLRRLGAGARP